MCTCAALSHLLQIRLRKAAINRLAFLVYRVVDSVGLGRD